MNKDTQMDSKQVNQHKRLAMGEKVTGMKKGGKVEKEMKPEKMAMGGIACKKGGMAKKKK